MSQKAPMTPPVSAPTFSASSMRRPPAPPAGLGKSKGCRAASPAVVKRGATAGSRFLLDQPSHPPAASEQRHLPRRRDRQRLGRRVPKGKRRIPHRRHQQPQRGPTSTVNWWPGDAGERRRDQIGKLRLVFLTRPTTGRHCGGDGRRRATACGGSRRLGRRGEGAYPARCSSATRSRLCARLADQAA